MTVPDKSGAGEKKHSLLLKNRERLTLDGVCEVISFDENAVILRTVLGTVTVEGEGLHVTKLLLDCGEVNVEGKVSALFYSDRHERGRGGFFQRLGR